MTAVLAGSIEKIVFANPDTRFTVARLRPTQSSKAEDDMVTVVGALPAVRPGERVDLVGDWESHPQHGVNFRVAHCDVHAPDDSESLVRLLSSGLVRGVGPVKARAIVETFGDSTLDVIEQHPERLASVPGIGPVHAEAIFFAWQEQGIVRAVMSFLSDRGIDPSYAARIVRYFGSGSLDVVQNDPFRLEREVPGIGFITADKLALQLGTKAADPERLVSGVRWVLGLASDEGHTFLTASDLVTRAARLLDVPQQRIMRALDQGIKQDLFVRELDGDRVFLAPLYLAEAGVARRLKTLASFPSVLNTTQAAKRTPDGLVLAPRQRAAVAMCLKETVSIITGGPGTGKTSTVQTLLAALDAAGNRVVLAAPTGRAARRLSEITGRQAMTLHRLLDYDPNTRTFRRGDDWPIEAEVIVVDEVSMLDILMAYRLLKAIRPGCHLVLIGDADQLPSIGPGNVLRDLVASDLPSVELVDVFRQAAHSDIVINAHRVRRGMSPKVENSRESDLFFLNASNAETAADRILEVVSERLPSRLGFDPMNDVQVLSPLYAGPAGVDALNVRLQKVLNPPHPSKPEVFEFGRIFRKGDRVMQTRNDYDRDVSNGDIGVIRHVDPASGKVVVVFGSEEDGRFVGYQPYDLDELTHAYAISVHKAQGAEFPAVVMPLVPQHYAVLERNLLYSAMTRARQLCVLVGRMGTATVAAGRNKADRRNTALRDRLKMNMAPVSPRLRLVTVS